MLGLLFTHSSGIYELTKHNSVYELTTMYIGLSYLTLMLMLCNLYGLMTEIRNSHILHAFESIQKSKNKNVVTLKLPAETRWNSFVCCLQSFISNKQALKALEISEDLDITDVLKNTIKTTILRDDFWNKIESLLDILSPIAKWTTFFEKMH